MSVPKSYFTLGLAVLCSIYGVRGEETLHPNWPPPETRSAEFHSAVSQIFNLQTQQSIGSLKNLAAHADSKSAIQQNTILRDAETDCLISATQGSVVVLSNLWRGQRDLPVVPLKFTDAHGPQLLLSDKPEYFYTGNGISLQEEVKPGIVRLYIYHVPQPASGPKTISAVIENLGRKPLKFRFLRRAFPKPSRDYHFIGKTGLIQFFNSKPEKTVGRLAPAHPNTAERPSSEFSSLSPTGGEGRGEGVAPANRQGSCRKMERADLISPKKLGELDISSSSPQPSPPLRGREGEEPAQRMVIDPDMDAATVTTDELVHGFYEFSINQPARITVFERDPGQSSVGVIDQLPKLPRELPGHEQSGAGRGIFAKSEYKVTGESNFVADTALGPMRLLVADGRKDPWITGRDDIAELESGRDSGNYGVIYHIRLKYRSSDGRGFALLMTKPSRGGRYCRTQAGAVQINQGQWPAGTVAIPSDRIAYGENPGEMVLIQKFPAPHRGWTGTIEITYSPPGASCIPTPMLLVPY